MKKYVIILFIINCFLIADSNWEVLNREEVLIKVLKSDYPHCEAELVINHSIYRERLQSIQIDSKFCIP